MDKPGLGKGLDALLPNLGVEDQGNVKDIEVDKIRENPDQPRKNVSQEKMDELINSVKEHGLLQPIIVRSIGNLYQVVAGERRWKAAKQAGFKKVPVIVKELSDSDVMQVALLENIQREDLNPMEKSYALGRLINEHGLTQEKLAERLGKSRSAIANTLRLLNLENEVQELVSKNFLSDGHARVLLAVKGENQVKAAREVVDKDLSVRKTEQLVKNFKNKKRENVKLNEKKNPYFEDIENTLEKQLGTKVNISSGKKKGKIEIEFLHQEELDEIVKVLINQDG